MAIFPPKHAIPSAWNQSIAQHKPVNSYSSFNISYFLRESNYQLLPPAEPETRVNIPIMSFPTTRYFYFASITMIVILYLSDYLIVCLS